MSRTFRRPNHERICRTWRDGTKIGGFYRQRDYDYRERDYTGHGSRWIYREPTRQEERHDYWQVHKDGRYYASKLRPWKSYRQRFERDLKMHDKTELHRYLVNPDDYEPQFWVMKPIDWRDWD